MKDIAIVDLLAQLGIVGDDAERGREALVAAGLTNPRKARISVEKIDAARTAVDATLTRLCRRCAGDDATAILVSPEACPRCAGSPNARALDELVAEATASGLVHLVVVGGSPEVRRQFDTLPEPLEVRCIEGVLRRTGEQAKRDVDWADVIVVCGSSELYHRVSNLYTREPAARGKVIVSARRGVEAIAGEIVEHLRRRAGG